jgi:heme/copper-type cytochrome/quinol oxidase subunit 2
MTNRNWLGKAARGLAVLLLGAAVFTACQDRAGPTMPAGTPTPGAATVIRLRAVRWAWQWIQGPGTTPSNPSSSITLKTGQTYELHVLNGDIPDDVYRPHWFSGIFGWIAGSQLPYTSPDYVVTVVAPAPGTYGFSCQEFDCGPTAQHEGMLGSIVVIP